MPLRDFICESCGMLQERYYTEAIGPWVDLGIVARKLPKCSCGGMLIMQPRSNEGEGHTTHVRIK